MFLYGNFCSVRLSVRSLDFQSGKTGSTPVPSTIFGDVGKLVTPVDCKSAALVHCVFDSHRLHQILARSYKGNYAGLSIRTQGFDSPTSRQVYALDCCCESDLRPNVDGFDSC